MAGSDLVVGGSCEVFRMTWQREESKGVEFTGGGEQTGRQSGERPEGAFQDPKGREAHPGLGTAARSLLASDM